MQENQLDIRIREGVRLLIYSENNPVFRMDDAADYGEACWQLMEGKEYDYELIDDELKPVNWVLDGPPAILSRNPRHQNQGTISTGIYVGTLTLKARNLSSSEEFDIRVEVQSVKTSYRKDYRKMLSDITSYYTDLVMQQGSPVTQKFDVDYDTPPETLYQKFSFVKSIVDSDDFDEAIHKIMSNPVRKWTETTVDKHIDSIHRITRNGLRQLVTRNDRIAVENGPYGLESLPRTLTVAHKKDTLDTPENQFVKYVLTSFYSFCTGLSGKKNATEQLKAEVDAVCNKLAGYMNGLFFKDVSNPSQLNLGSPVLQRKEGYREILQAWLMFDLAAKITWTGGDNVYEAGKKNVAVLYEYWIFFKLMEVVGRVFKIPTENTKDLVKADSDSINLEIRQGRRIMIGGVADEGTRRLNVRLYYNRTFSHTGQLNQAGSWTMNMRPDYTLSIWPGEMTESDAEQQDAIVHIHFDAKYRLNKIIIDDKPVSDEELDKEMDVEKEDREINIYKRGDLLKMHAYKDAIRRTAGAYVLYPGEKPTIKRGFHEIIPGLGAFCIAPGSEDEQLPALEGFLKAVAAHFMDRTSQREKVTIAEREIHSQESSKFIEQFPEPYDGVPMFPDTTPVLVGCYKSQEHLNWILSSGRYNVRLDGPREGAVSLDEKYLSVKYLLLYNFSDRTEMRLLKINGEHPSAMSSEGISALGYPAPTPGQMYLVYEVSEDKVEDELKGRPWTIEGIINKRGRPEVVYYTNLFENAP